MSTNTIDTNRLDENIDDVNSFDLIETLKGLVSESYTKGRDCFFDLTEINRHKALLALSKDKLGVYKACAIVVFSTHCEVVKFNDGGFYDVLDDQSIVVLKNGMSFAKNPARNIKEYLSGFIDARVAQIENDDEIIKLKQQEQKMSTGPRTNPTEKEKARMKQELERLLDTVTAPALKIMFGYSAQKVGTWKQRGRISATAAHEICQHEQIKKRGFTRESLRPDVKFWTQDLK